VVFIVRSDFSRVTCGGGRLAVREALGVWEQGAWARARAGGSRGNGIFGKRTWVCFDRGQVGAPACFRKGPGH
jgi:hypothetical protein